MVPEVLVHFPQPCHFGQGATQHHGGKDTIEEGHLPHGGQEVKKKRGAGNNVYLSLTYFLQAGHTS